MGVRENKVETYLDKMVELAGGTTRKWVSPGVDGVPDRIVFFKGMQAFPEVKTESGKLSEAQVREHARLRSHGATVVTVYGHGGVDAFVADLIRKQITMSEYK